MQFKISKIKGKPGKAGSGYSSTTVSILCTTRFEALLLISFIYGDHISNKRFKATPKIMCCLCANHNNKIPYLINLHVYNLLLDEGTFVMFQLWAIEQ